MASGGRGWQSTGDQVVGCLDGQPESIDWSITVVELAGLRAGRQFGQENQAGLQ